MWIKKNNFSSYYITLNHIRNTNMPFQYVFDYFELSLTYWRKVRIASMITTKSSRHSVSFYVVKIVEVFAYSGHSRELWCNYACAALRFDESITNRSLNYTKHSDNKIKRFIKLRISSMGYHFKNTFQTFIYREYFEHIF